MLDAAAKSVIKESTTGQLTEMYYRIVGVNSLRSAQGVGKEATTYNHVTLTVTANNKAVKG
jgi:hypothetical protein